MIENSPRRIESEATLSIADYKRPKAPEADMRTSPFETFVTPSYAQEVVDALPFQSQVEATIQVGAHPDTAAIQLMAQTNRFLRLAPFIQGPGFAFAIDRGIELGELSPDYTYREPGSNSFLGLAFINKQNQPRKATGVDFEIRHVAAGNVGIPELQNKGYITAQEVQILHTEENHTKDVYDLQGHILFTQYKPVELVLEEAVNRSRSFFSVDLLHQPSEQTEEEQANSVIIHKAQTLDGRLVRTGVAQKLVGKPTEVADGVYVQSAHLLLNNRIYNSKNVRMDTSPYDVHETKVTYQVRNGVREVLPWTIDRGNATDETYEKWLSIGRVFPDIFTYRSAATNGAEKWCGNNQSYLVDKGVEMGFKGRARYTTLGLRPAILPGMVMYFAEQIGQMSQMGLIDDIGPGKLYAHPGELIQFMRQYLNPEGADRAMEEVKLYGPTLGMVMFPNFPKPTQQEIA